MTAIEESGAHGPVYGYRIVHSALKQRGFNTNEKTVRIIMNELTFNQSGLGRACIAPMRVKTSITHKI